VHGWKASGTGLAGDIWVLILKTAIAVFVLYAVLRLASAGRHSCAAPDSDSSCRQPGLREPSTAYVSIYRESLIHDAAEQDSAIPLQNFIA
jgi:hypothetical protein